MWCGTFYFDFYKINKIVWLYYTAIKEDARFFSQEKISYSSKDVLYVVRSIAEKVARLVCISEKLLVFSSIAKDEKSQKSRNTPSPDQQSQKNEIE